MKNLFSFLLSAFFLSASIARPATCWAQIITTVAGDSTEGYNSDNIPATTAELNQPTGVAVDAAGNIYIADRNNNRIRKVSASSGIITTIAGTGTAGFSGDGGPATAAEINNPYCIALDAIGNIYYADSRVRKIDTSGIITTIAGNGTDGYNSDNIPATSAELNGPSGIAIDNHGNIYVADVYNNRIRKINTAGIITTIAGTGTCSNMGDGGLATAAGLCQPYGVAFDGMENLYIVEYVTNRIRKVDTTGIITTIAGTGTAGYNGDGINADSAELDHPLSIAADVSGNVYIGDTFNERVRKVDISGIITTIAGDGIDGYNGDNGSATLAELAVPVGVTIDNSGNVYIADFANSRIRRVGWPELINNVNSTEADITIYPNPSCGLFTIKINSNFNEQVQVTITNTLGQQVKEITTFTNSPTAIQLNQPTGVYYLSAISEHGNWSGEITILS